MKGDSYGLASLEYVLNAAKEGFAVLTRVSEVIISLVISGEGR